MSPKELTAFRMAPELMAAMREVKAREGIPIAVQIDFAVREWLKKRGLKVKRPTAAPRTRRKANP